MSLTNLGRHTLTSHRSSPTTGTVQTRKLMSTTEIKTQMTSLVRAPPDPSHSGPFTHGHFRRPNLKLHQRLSFLPGIWDQNKNRERQFDPSPLNPFL